MASCKNCGLPDPNHSAHGTQSGYSYHGCRCSRCKSWNAQQGRISRTKNPEYYLTYERERAMTPKRQAQRRTYSKINAEALNMKFQAYRVANLERYRAHEVRRRIALSRNMSKDDKEFSVGYRLAIKFDKCFYCKNADGEEDDHFFPVSKGGSDYWFNLRRACRPCNNQKRARCGTWFMLKEFSENFSYQ